MNQQSLHAELVQLLATVDENPQAALLQAEKAILWASRNGWVSILALANLVAGKANIHQQLLETAVENFQRAMTLFKDLSEAELVGQSYYGLASAYTRQGEYSLAIAHYRKAISWLNRANAEHSLIMIIRMALAHALMNLNYWSDAEQELLSISETVEFNDRVLADYQMMILRLAFYRGDQRMVREQLQLCRELVLSLNDSELAFELEYYSARYTTKYEKVKQGEQMLADIWQRIDRANIDTYYLAYESALDLLHSDYPQKGIHWLSLLLEEDLVPLPMQRQVHLSLAHFFVAHNSHELATEHYQAAEKLDHSIHENEVSQQWARYRADDDQQQLRNQVEQHQRNNQILAESNALLQAVNRIALAVNSALDLESLLRRLRDQLIGWIDVEIVAIAELKDDALYFNCALESDQKLPPDVMPLTEERAWSVRSVNEGRILYENDFVLKDEISMGNSPSMVRSVSFAPLKCENRVIGVLTLQSRKAQVFDSRAISLLEYISPVIGIAFASLLHLERTRELSGELNKQQQELDDVRQLMAHLVDHDEVTGLPNRTSLPEHFERWRSNAPFHCLAVKINNLDEVNNSVGFGSDEEVIKVIAQRLRNRLRPDDLLIRAGTDHFLLIVEGMASKENLFDFAGQLHSLATQPLRAKDHTIGAEVIIGAVQYPDHGDSLEEIMSMVSIALQHALADESGIFCIE